MTDTIATLTGRMDKGETTSLARTTECLARILDAKGEGARAFTMIDPERSIAQARHWDDQRAQGAALPPLAGVPISVKCLFDLKGRVTHAGSRVLADAAPAVQDAAIVARLRAAGAVIMGHTNMTEFAYSGLGLNPHYGTPGNPDDRTRIPGGSSSGAGVSVADGMAYAAIGTDTGGSCRIPASFCGLVGWKPTARRVPQDGCFPLSASLDSIGAIASSVACVETVDAVMAGDTDAPLPEPGLSDLHFAVLDNYVMEGLSPLVAESYAREVAALEAAGAKITHISLPDLEDLPALNARGGIIAAEAWAVHKDLLAEKEADYDPRVAVRIHKALTQEDGELAQMLATRAEMIARADQITKGYEAVLMPTVAMEAPTIAEMEDDDTFGRLNLLALRNTTVANFFDRCAISIPMRTGGLPAGIMLMGQTMGDRALLATARAVEALLTE